MNLSKIACFVLLFLVTSIGYSQRGWKGEYTKIGLQGGANYFNILTDDLPVQGKVSWTAGFTTRDAFYNDWQLVYGINFFDFNIDMDGREKELADSEKTTIPYNMVGVQANLFASYKVIDHYFSLEAGPVVQFNGKLDARQDREYNYVAGYDFQAIDIEKITPFSVNLAVGATGGFDTVKFWAQYQHGIINILGRLDSAELGGNEFSGNMSMIAAGIVVFL